jgi:hypothetical protein
MTTRLCRNVSLFPAMSGSDAAKGRHIAPITLSNAASDFNVHHDAAILRHNLLATMQNIWTEGRIWSTLLHISLHCIEAI